MMTMLWGLPHTLYFISIERLKISDDSFQPDTHFIELADGTKMNGVTLKRGDAEICLVNANGNKESVILKRALFIPFYS